MSPSSSQPVEYSRGASAFVAIVAVVTTLAAGVALAIFGYLTFMVLSASVTGDVDPTIGTDGPQFLHWLRENEMG